MRDVSCVQEWWLFYMTLLPHIQMWVYVSSPFWVTAWRVDCDRRDARWLLRLGNKRPCSFPIEHLFFLKPPPKNSDYPANAMLAGSQVGSILNTPSQAQPFRNPCRSVTLLPSRAAYLSARHHWGPPMAPQRKLTQPNPVQISHPQNARYYEMGIV